MARSFFIRFGMNRRLVIVGGILLAGALVLALRFGFLGPDRMLHIVREWGYWAMWALAAPGFWLFGGKGREWLGALRREAQGARWAWGVVLVLAAWQQFHEPRLAKVNYDEHVLLSISRMMHLEQTAAWTAESRIVAGTPVPTVLMVDKRPLFYPFVLSNVHKLAGYRVENLFWVNGLLAALFLAFVFLLCRRYGGPLAGVTGACLMGGVPLLAQNATAGGFDLLNVTLLSGLALAAARYLEAPDRRRLGLMVWVALMLANVRYESALFLLVPAICYGLVWIRSRALPDLGAWLVLAPLGLLPNLFSNAVFASHETFFQMPKEQFWSLANFGSNLEHAAAYLLDFGPSGTSAWWLAVGGTICAVASFLVVRRHLTRPGAQVFLVCLLAVALQVLVVLGLSWGKWDDPLVARFTFPLWLILVWSVIICTEHLRSFGVVRAPAMVLGCAVFAGFVWGSAKSSYAQDTRSLRLPDALAWAGEKLDRLDPRRRALILADSAIPFCNFGFAANTLDKAISRRENLRAAIHHRLYDEIYLVVGHQRRLPGGAWEPSEGLGEIEAIARLELVDDMIFDPFYKVAILRVVGLRDSQEVLPWPLPDEEGQDRTYRRRVYELMP